MIAVFPILSSLSNKAGLVFNSILLGEKINFEDFTAVGICEISGKMSAF
jgi:hypothetical protein